jgi:hypothetical protein
LPRAPEEGAVTDLMPDLVTSGVSYAITARRALGATGVGGSTPRAFVVATLLRERFRNRAAALAADYVRGGTLSTWQFGMRTLMAEHLVAMHLIGGSAGEMAILDRARLGAAYLRDTAYLSRFADTIAVHHLLGVPLGEAAIAGRSVIYEGTGYGAFFRAREGLGDLTGWVAVYRAKDDLGTCSSCAQHAAEGPYLPTDGPMPGSDCLAGGRCRCERELTYDPAMYAALTGGNP